MYRIINAVVTGRFYSTVPNKKPKETILDQIHWNFFDLEMQF
jgi:hypothetical protein